MFCSEQSFVRQVKGRDNYRVFYLNPPIASVTGRERGSDNKDRQGTGFKIAL